MSDETEVQPTPPEVPSAAPRDRRRMIAAVALVAVLVIGGLLAFSGDSDDADGDATVEVDPANDEPGDDGDRDGASDTADDESSDDDPDPQPPVDEDLPLAQPQPDPDPKPNPIDGPDELADNSTNSPAQAARKWVIAVAAADWETAHALTGPDTRGEVGSIAEMGTGHGDQLMKSWSGWAQGVENLETHLVAVPFAGDPMTIVTYSGVPEEESDLMSTTLLTRTVDGTALVEWLPGPTNVEFKNPKASQCVSEGVSTAVEVQTSPQMFLFANEMQVGPVAHDNGDQTLLVYEPEAGYEVDTAVVAVTIVNGRIHHDSRQFIANC